MENLYTEGCIRTYTGIYLDVLNPTEDMIDIRDIAHSLSMMIRFQGHIPKPYSVAQHSWNCSRIVTSWEDKLAALLHDSAEFVWGDLNSPCKSLVPDYKAHENKLLSVIAKKFGFQYPLSKAVKDADKKMLEEEWNKIMLQKDKHFPIYTQKEAEMQFLLMFKYINDNLDCQ